MAPVGGDGRGGVSHRPVTSPGTSPFDRASAVTRKATLMIFSELTLVQERVNFFLWLFMLGILFTTLGLSGVVSFRLQQSKHQAPPRYRGRRRRGMRRQS